MSKKKSGAKKASKKKDEGRGPKKKKKVDPIPKGYPTVTPYLAVEDCKRAIEWYEKVFDGKEKMRLTTPDGKIGHAEVKIGDAVVMLSDAIPEWGTRSAKEIGGTPVALHVFVKKVDDVFGRAIAAGATEERAVEDQFYGDRMGTFVDPFGLRWSVGSRIEKLSEKQIQKRMDELMSGGAPDSATTGMPETPTP